MPGQTECRHTYIPTFNSLKELCTCTIRSESSSSSHVHLHIIHVLRSHPYIVCKLQCWCMMHATAPRPCLSWLNYRPCSLYMQGKYEVSTCQDRVRESSIDSEDTAERDIYLHRNYWTPWHLILSYGISAASLRYYSACLPTLKPSLTGHAHQNRK